MTEIYNSPSPLQLETYNKAYELIFKSFDESLRLADEPFSNEAVRAGIEHKLLIAVDGYLGPDSDDQFSCRYEEVVAVLVAHGMNAKTSVSWATELFRTLGIDEARLQIAIVNSIRSLEAIAIPRSRKIKKLLGRRATSS